MHFSWQLEVKMLPSIESKEVKRSFPDVGCSSTRVCMNFRGKVTLSWRDGGGHTVGTPCLSQARTNMFTYIHSRRFSFPKSAWNPFFILMTVRKQKMGFFTPTWRPCAASGGLLYGDLDLRLQSYVQRPETRPEGLQLRSQLPRQHAFR